jgi:hypothetical protein
MRRSVKWALRFVCAAAVAGVLVWLSAGAGAQSVGASARTELVSPQGGSLRRAHGLIVAREDADGSSREILTIRLRGMTPGARYTLLCDDPSTPDTTATAFATVRAGRDRSAMLRLDTARGDQMPHGATVDTLAGLRFEVRDARGFLVLSGGMPDPRGLKAAAAAAAAASGCVFTEESVFSDNFDADTPAAAPTGWDVTGTEVVVDNTVRDGTTGASVRIADTDAVTGAPTLSHAFTAQDKFFAVEFTLISSAANGRIVFRLAEDTGTGPVYPTGFGDGLGFREDGTIGFVGSDSLGTYTPNTAYKFRIDVDLGARTFDVSLNGAAVVTARALGFTDPSLTRITFGGAATTTGTAYVDTVSVIHKTQNCPPVANAGPDQVVSATDHSTAVTLDGSASSDPEAETLTYAWSGDFTEATATGDKPTVHFTTLGNHTVTLVVNDGTLDSPPDTVVIDIVDVTPPTIVVSNLPVSLWPPNHQMIHVLPAVQVTDDVDTSPDVTLTITSNEPDDGMGDGSTTGDVVVNSPSDFELRAERAGSGSGRVYHLVWTATDDSGNKTTLARDIVVPHDHGHGFVPGGSQGGSAGPGTTPAPVGGSGTGGSTGGQTPPTTLGNGHGRGHAYGHNR